VKKNDKKFELDNAKEYILTPTQHQHQHQLKDLFHKIEGIKTSMPTQKSFSIGK